MSVAPLLSCSDSHFLDRVSTTGMSSPGLWMIVKSYLCSCTIIRCRLGGSAADGLCMMHSSGLWSTSCDGQRPTGGNDCTKTAYGSFFNYTVDFTVSDCDAYSWWAPGPYLDVSTCSLSSGQDSALEWLVLSFCNTLSCCASYMHSLDSGRHVREHGVNLDQ